MSKKVSSDCAVFKCPVQKLAFYAWESSEKHKLLLTNHFFNHAVSMVIPGSVTKQQIDNAVSPLLQQQHYRVEKIPLLKLIDVEFIEAFVKKGDMYMLSCDTHIDTSPLCVALHPPGKLILNMSKEVYEQFGLEGKPSRFTKKQCTRYVVTIDLTQSSFHPGKNNYKRVEWCFSNNRLDFTMTFFVSWIPHDNAVCPSSIGAYFTSCGFKTTERKQRKVKRRLDQISNPDFNFSSHIESDFDCNTLYEWLGFVACDCDDSDNDGFISSYCCPEPKSDTSNGVWLTKLSGMLIPHSIVEAMEQLQNLMKAHSLPWICLTAHGFADSPVSWSGYEHGYRTNGDNLLTFVMFPNSSFWLYAALGTNDMYS